MASSSSSLSLPLQLLRTGTSSSPIGLRSVYRPSPSTRLRLPVARGLRPIAAVSYNDEAAGHGGDAIAAATSVLLRQVDGNAVAAELRAARTPGRRGPQAPKGRPAGKPKEGGGGNGGKIHAVPVASLRKPKEGSGGQDGSTN
ncbi:unnamed protein product [Urochloa humidicola]